MSELIPGGLLDNEMEASIKIESKKRNVIVLDSFFKKVEKNVNSGVLKIKSV